MQIQKFRNYFLYGVPFYEDILQVDRTDGTVQMLIDDLAVNEGFIRALCFGKEQAAAGIHAGKDLKDIIEQDLATHIKLKKFKTYAELDGEDNISIEYPQHIIPNFYTWHYRDYHTPYYVDYPNRQITLPKERLNAYDLFKETPLTSDITLKWDFIFALETCPVINIVIESDTPVSSDLAYRLSSLHLSNYSFIPTEDLQDLFLPEDERPEYINLQKLVRVIQKKFYRIVGLGAFVETVQLEALVHLPFTSIEVNSNYNSQAEFIAENKGPLVDLISKPAGFEFTEGSRIHENTVLREDRMWSVSEDTLFIVAYSGGLYIKLTNLIKKRDIAISNYRLVDENSVFHSFWLAVANYYLLRIVDDELDQAIHRLSRSIRHHRKELTTLYDPDIPNQNETLSHLNNLVIETSNLRFQFLDLQEELDNSDKLIDEEWHIDLLDKINAALGMKMWRDNITVRMDNLRELVQVLEDSYERFLNLSAAQEGRDLERQNAIVSIIFSAFAGAEILGLILAVAMNNEDTLYLWVQDDLPRLLGSSDSFSAGASHLIATIIVLVAIAVIAVFSLLAARGVYYYIYRFAQSTRQADIPLIVEGKKRSRTDNN